MFKKLAKQAYLKSPDLIKTVFIYLYETFFYFKTYVKFKKQIKSFERREIPEGEKANILLYHISALSFGGTEKFLQIIAKYINKEKYKVYFMYSPKPRYSSGQTKLDGRKGYLENSDVELIEFDYEELDNKYPYTVEKMSPSIFEVLHDKKIDLLITAGSGYSEFPFNIIRHIPIVLINIFSSPNRQVNIVKNICISHDVSKKVSNIIPKDKIDTIYIQSEKPNEEYKQRGLDLRKSLGIKETDFVFGRIGRPDDNIFDPIALNAFKQLRSDTQIHYIIMSPPPIAVKKVKDDNIKNVHFINPSSKEEDVWAFHYSLDAMAHFRNDGESFGLNIAESMIAGNPIITHKSHIWNSHLEYLDEDFSVVVEKDDVYAYKKAMEKMIKSKNDGSILKMKNSAKNKASELFVIDSNIKKIENIIDEALK